ncbi:MAG: SAM-dependent methyltransferase [Gammaproteobacteria bacterium]|nr:SAM-dependent methyltransferase [Gammaproteobacteria bacterium]MBL7000112.1 SAM-dependent methyltransferase [Gammaproteobacteria bacterium]
MSSYHPAIELPAPDPQQIAHSSRLIECIIQHIEAAGGVISFRDYMQYCLYEPGLGYYAAGATKFGAAGDFVTAPEVSALFGQTLANHLRDLFSQGVAPQMLEFGAGTGKLCVDIIQRLNALGVDWLAYSILETSSDLQQRQQTLLEQQLSSADLQKVSWLSGLPQAFNGVVLGNEVLDAMPVNILLKDKDWLELGVAYRDQQFVWQPYSSDSAAVQQMRQIDADQQLPDQYCTELNLNYQPWCKSLAEVCHQAVLLLVDYGYLQPQYYHPQRYTGTLVCFYQHRVHPDPLIYPGLQDVTAFVDFDAFADAALETGFRIVGLFTQAEFLIANGLLELLPAAADAMQQITFSQQVKSLTLPGEMGEKFKVIELHKGLDLS